MAIAQITILFILGTVPILFAAVQPWVWSVYGSCMIVAFLVFLWQDRNQLSIVPGVSINLAVALFFVVTLFLCIPLPTNVLSYLSPVRYQTLMTAQDLLNRPASWQTLSYIPRLALSWWVFLICLCLLFGTVRRLCADAKTLKRVVLVMMCVAMLEAAYGLIQALVPTMGVLWVDYVQAYMGSARGTFINRNHFAGFMEMTWPLALGFTMAQGGWGQGYSLKKILASERLNRQALLALGVVVLLLALLFSRSRAGIAGALIGLLTFILLTRSGRKGISRYSWLMLAGIVGLLVVYSMAIGIGPITERFFALSNGDSRLDYWRDSLPIIKDHPLGIGLRNYDNVIPVYNVSMLADKRLEYAHNDYLQLLIEAGWIGFIAVLTGFLIFMWKNAYRIRHMNPQKDPMRFFLAVGAFSGLISLTFHSFFDFNLQIPANCVYFVTLMAILYSCAWRSADSPELNQKMKKIATNRHSQAQITNRK
ncbi:MAG: O-antigen ligase family protein [Desulfobacterales bacterium]